MEHLDASDRTDPEEGRRRDAKARSKVVAFAVDAADATPPPGRDGPADAATFLVLVEYDDASYHDVISTASSRVIRKRLLIVGEDVVVGGAGPDLSVQLRVLQDHPLSGHPEGEVRRALCWKRCLALNGHVLAGATLVATGAAAVWTAAPRPWFYVYVCLLFLPLPLLDRALDDAFDKIVHDKYIANGVALPAAQRTFRLDDGERQAMVAALKQGTSFD